MYHLHPQKKNPAAAGGKTQKGGTPMPHIQQLSPHVADLIAAGEVAPCIIL